MKPGGARGSQGEPGEARRGQGEPGGARRGQEEPGGRNQSTHLGRRTLSSVVSGHVVWAPRAVGWRCRSATL